MNEEIEKILKVVDELNTHLMDSFPDKLLYTLGWEMPYVELRTDGSEWFISYLSMPIISSIEGGMPYNDETDDWYTEEEFDVYLRGKLNDFMDMTKQVCQVKF